MKIIVFTLAFYLLTGYQNIAQQGPSTDVTQAVKTMYIFNLNGRPWEEVKYGNIEGVPYLTEAWINGSVKLNKNRYFRDIPLRFDVYNNKLYFKKDSAEFSFLLPVNEFSIAYRENGDSSLFRNGYPAIDNNTDEIFYEVLVDGKFQLLNFYSKSIQTFTSYNEPPQKRFVSKSQLYVLRPDAIIVKLKYGRDEILSAIPAYADAIKSIVEKNKLKLKNDEQVRELFKHLNQQ
jgi:hypothetical protein